MIYIMSDIHGRYDKYIAMLEKINPTSKDRVYILGDVIDRGTEGIKILSDMMHQPYVIPLLGNHEYMAYTVLSALAVEITEDNYNNQVTQNSLLAWQEWICNGGHATQDDFLKLHRLEQKKLLNYMQEFSLYEEITVNEKDYVLVHGGLRNFSPERELCDYDIRELVWARADYHRVYFEDKILVTGHTPTFTIAPKYRGKIYKLNNHIAVDCGVSGGENLGCICLDTMEEFYV